MRYSDSIQSPTKPGKYFFLVVFFSLLFALSAFSQTKEEKKLRIKAVKALNSGDYEIAQEIYTDLLKLDPLNPDYNYEMGLAIFEEGIFRDKAAPYFESAIQNTEKDSLADMYLYAGRAQQHAGHFNLAIDYYRIYQKMARDLDENSMSEFNVARAIEMCENGKVQFENSKDHIVIENMGEAINSEFADYSPVVTNDEEMILFTSRRASSTGGDLASDQKFFEDIYYSINIDGQWTMASNVDSTSKYMNSMINTETHDATITFAGDETQLYIYRDLDVWISTKTNGTWSAPSKASNRINTSRGFEPSVFITQDEQIMFVVSDIGTGYGGRDIYITKKDKNGKWASLKNLGKNINTEFDEDAPFLTPDGNTLYFASNGHNSMGDYDIFKSILDENGEFGAPINLGAPINTPGHDRYFVTTDSGAVGYYASDRPGGYGETDIYRIILDCKAVSATMIRGIVLNGETKQPTYATIELYDPVTNDLINTYVADSVKGEYEMRLKTEKEYKFVIRAAGFLPHEGSFKVPQQCEYYNLFQEIEVENLKDNAGRVYAQRASINNAFFNIDKKVEERFAEAYSPELSETEKDSLRLMVTKESHPIELTNYVQMLDILDPRGTKLANSSIGDVDVALIQTRDLVYSSYNNVIVEADKQFYAEKLPEARANYLVATTIKPEEEYPKQQVEIIDERLDDQPFEALLSSLVEEDKSDMVDIETIEESKPAIPIETTTLRGLVYNQTKDQPLGAALEIFNKESGELVKSITIDPENGEYELNLDTETAYEFVLTAENFKTHRGDFMIPAQTEEYDLFQEITLEKLVDSEGRTYAQKAVVNNAFFNVDEVAIEKYPTTDFTAYSMNQIDSIRFEITSSTSPVELVNYVKQTEVLDPNGNLLAQATLGRLYVPDAPMKEMDLLYQNALDSAKSNYDSDKLPEARANYLIASDIKPSEEYPKEQVAKIDSELKDKPFEALLAYLPEVDNGEMITETALAEENTSTENNSETLADDSESETEDMLGETKESLVADNSATVEEKTDQSNVAEAKLEVTDKISFEESPKKSEVTLTQKTEDKSENVSNTAIAMSTNQDVAEESTQNTNEEVVSVVSDTKTDSSNKQKDKSPTNTEDEAPMNASQKVVFRNILFDFDKSDLREASITELNRISAYMKKQPGVELRIDGHADWIGSIEYNLKLSEKRAQRAYYYLVSEGVSDGRLSYQYFGESLPIAPNANPDGSDNPEGRQLNRRCEFKIDETGTAENVILRF